jgi:hypothetical protein
MFEGYYAEQAIRQRERERRRVLAKPGPHGVATPGDGRAVLSGDWSGWSWRRARAVLGTVGVALVASVALPVSVQALAWGLRGMLELMGR